MEILGRIVSEPEERVFNTTRHDGTQGSTTCVDAIVDDGLNKYLCSQFDASKNTFPKNGDFVRVDLRFTIRKTEKDGLTRYFQSIRINAISKV